MAFGYDSYGRPTTKMYSSGNEVTTIADDRSGIAEKRGSTKSYQHSGLKNVDAQSNSSATISATREYDAFGGVITGSGTTGTFNGPFGHAGNFGYQSEGSGLQLLGHRWYDPEVGRFLTRDPIQDGKNWFAYCANNPLGRVDPDGLDPDRLGWKAGKFINASDTTIIVYGDVGPSESKRIPVCFPVPPGYETNPDVIDVDYYEDPRDGDMVKMGPGWTKAGNNASGNIYFSFGTFTFLIYVKDQFTLDGVKVGDRFPTVLRPRPRPKKDPGFCRYEEEPKPGAPGFQFGTKDSPAGIPVNEAIRRGYIRKR